MKSNIANPNGILNNELFYELIEHTYNNISHFEKQKEFALNSSFDSYHFNRGKLSGILTVAELYLIESNDEVRVVRQYSNQVMYSFKPLQTI